jgi:hypothetical protein
VGFHGGCSVLGQAESRNQPHPATGRGPAPPKPRRPGPDSGVGGVPAPVQRGRRVCYATPLQEVGSDPDRIVFQWTRTWSWPKLMGCAKPRGAPRVAPVPTLHKPTESGPKPLQCRSAHRRNASASSKPNHCRPPFPPWYWFGVAEFAPVGFPTLCCGASQGVILRSPHRFGSSRKTKTVIGPLFGETRSIHPFYRQDPSDRFESSSIGLPASRCGARVGLCGQCKILLPSWEPKLESH